MKAHLTLMAYGGLDNATVDAAVRELSRGESDVHWVFKTHAGDAAVDRARSKVATEFIRSDADVLVCVDHDIIWNPGDAAYIAKLAVSKNSVVGGLYSKRSLGSGFGGRFGDGKPHEYGTEELVELGEDAYLGGGFVAIPKEVIVHMGAFHNLPMTRCGFVPFYMPMTKYNEKLEVTEYLSEDWAFVHRVRQSGHKVFCSMKPFLVHKGEYMFTVIGTNEMKSLGVSQ